MAASEPETIYSFSAKLINGKETSLSVYKGMTVMIVNTASQCGFTGQYQSLQELYKRYKDKGLIILAFPANNFMRQEPGTNEDIKKFCDLRFKITFPLFEKIDVKGKKIHPLYEYLTKRSPFPGKITWNFNKFLVAPDGRVVGRFGSKTDPLAAEVIGLLEKNLPPQ